MPKNLELKAPLASFSRALRIARALGARSRGVLLQTDTYYRTSSGRLKLRVVNGRAAELIAYARPDTARGRYSTYVVLPVRDHRLADGLFRVLLGVRVVVRKRRTLFLYRNARIHLDAVEGLGAFVEFEVLVTRGKRQARTLFDELVSAFGIDRRRMIAGSYSDILESRSKRRRSAPESRRRPLKSGRKKPLRA